MIYKISSIFVLFIILIFALSPKETIDIKLFEHSDKLKHIVAFLTLSFFFYQSFKKIKNIYKFLILALFTILLEVVQSFVGREASIIDAFSSLIGILLYLLILNVIKENTGENL